MFEWLSTPAVSAEEKRKEVMKISGNKLSDSDRMRRTFAEWNTVHTHLFTRRCARSGATLCKCFMFYSWSLTICYFLTPRRKDALRPPKPLCTVVRTGQWRSLGMGQWWRRMDGVRDTNLHFTGAQLPGRSRNSWFELARLQLHRGPHCSGAGQQDVQLQTARQTAGQRAVPSCSCFGLGYSFGPGLYLSPVHEQ